MRRLRIASLAFVLFGLGATASAHAASIVFIKKGDVRMSRLDGSRQVALTRNGTPGKPYYSPSISDNGTIVALRSIFLHSFRPNGRRIVKPRQWAINPTPALSAEPFSVDVSRNGKIVATENGLYSTYYDPRTSETRPTIAGRFIDFEAFVDAVYPDTGTPPRPVIPAPTDCSSYPGAFEAHPAGTPEVLAPGGLVVTDAPVPAPPPPAPPKYSVERETDLQWVPDHGITLELTCEAACRLKARLYLGAKQARRYGLAKGGKPVIVAKAKGRLTKAGDLSVIVTFKPRIRKGLRHARALRVVLKTTVAAADYTQTRTHPRRLKAAQE